MNDGKGVYLEGTNIGFDHQGTNFWDMFRATYMGQGQEHGDVETISGYENNFATSMIFGYQSYTYADIYINRLGTNGGNEVLISEEMYTRTISYTDTIYSAISSAVLFGALADGEDLSRKVDLMRLYMALLTRQNEPDIWLSRTELDFEYVLIDNPRELQLIIQNSGLNDLDISSISLNNDYFTLNTEPSYGLGFGENIILNIGFEASQTGIYESELSILSNDPDSPELIIPITVNCFVPQMITVEHEELNFTVGENETVESEITINNLGGGILDYQIVIYPNDQNGFRKAGGPDQFGYYWRDNFDDQGPEYDWFDISGLGENIGIIDVNSHAEIPLPFPFYFYGLPYYDIAVSSNGYLTFGNNAEDQSNDQIPFVIDPDNLIAPLWDYLTPGLGSVHSYFDETEYRFIIQYTDWSFYVSGGLSALTFQVQLYPNGKIAFIYETLEGDLTSCTVGIENYNASDGLQIAYNEDYLQGSMAIEIFFQPDWLQLDQYAGSIPHDDPDPLLLTVDSSGLSEGVYYAELQIYSNDTHNPFISIPITLNVSNTGAEDDVVVNGSKLIGNYPNPFNPSTVISFQLSGDSNQDVELLIFNIKGQKIKDLTPEATSSVNLSGVERSASTHNITWNGTNDNNQSVPSGVYFYKIKSGSFTDTKKMILMK
ncbi:choice-of-anchor D domain-containing protein [Candidatus Cloacimonadota bacterium]